MTREEADYATATAPYSVRFPTVYSVHQLLDPLVRSISHDTYLRRFTTKSKIFCESYYSKQCPPNIAVRKYLQFSHRQDRRYG